MVKVNQARISPSEEALFRIASTMLSIELGAACLYSEPPLFGYASSGGEKFGIVMAFAEMNGQEMVFDDVSSAPSWCNMVCVFVRKKAVGDNLLLIRRENYQSGQRNVFEVAKLIEFKQRLNVSRHG